MRGSNLTETCFKLGCGLFIEACTDVARDYPDIAFETRVVDTFAMNLVMNPQDFDVVVSTNMFGDILTDEAAGLVGGLGMAPGLNVGPKYAMAQATHGSAPDITGKHIANPYAMIVSGQMLLMWLGEKKQDHAAVQAAICIEKAITDVISRLETVTPDLKGSATTEEMGEAICRAIEAL